MNFGKNGLIRISYYLTVTLVAGVVFAACNPVSNDTVGQRMPVNGTDLFVKTMGKGEPLILLHGGPGLSHDYFLPHLKPLSKELKLVLFDQRGMGRSSVQLDSASFSLDLLVEDIEMLRRKLKLEQIHLLGHSWGGILAMRYAIRYPDRLKTLILCNSVPASSEFTAATFAGFARLSERQNMEDLQPLRRKMEEGSRDPAVYERFMQLTFRPMFYDTSRVNELVINFNKNYFKTRELLQLLPPLTEPVNLLPELQQVSVPSLIIRSEMEAIPVESDQRLRETLPNARLVSMDQAGHFPFIERPEAFKDTLLAFIRRH